MNRLPISVCMISGPEAHRIGRALESVAGWTSEIIVVLNQDVRDATEEIARKYGAKVFREPWKGHIAQKNSAATKAAGEWLLGLDADEAVSPELRKEIQHAIAGPAQSALPAAFSFPRLSWYCGRWIRHGDWYPDRQTRLWRRGCATWGGTDPHDKLRVNGPVRKLSADLYHYSRESIDAHLQKIIPFSDEFVRQHAGAGAGPSWRDLAFRPLWRFFRAYFLRRGFLDGWPGYYIACHTAFATLVRYAKVREFRSQQTSQPQAAKGE
jgi:glycosyltransferase involved in cell wall biosynthesis